MDVRFINPFVHGTVEAMKKIAGMDVQPGKVYLKGSNVAAGDVSGIIGITGDATGTLAISFTETCIGRIVGGRQGELPTVADRKVFDVVREITTMILAVAGTYIEQEGQKVYASLPTVVCGKSHIIAPLLDIPSITIPFSTEQGAFVVDLCLKSQATEVSQAALERVVKRLTPGPALATTVPESEVKPAAENVLSEMDRKALLKKQLTEANAARSGLMEKLAEKPFMEMSQRIKIKKTIPVLEAKIKRLKLDLAALEMIAQISSDEPANPNLAAHYQHFDSKKKRS